MLSDPEQRVWDDVQRFWAEDAVEPPLPVPGARPASRDLADPPAVVVAGVWGAILLILLGAPAAGLSVGLATALGWALWRYWPRLDRTDPTTTWSALGEGHRGLQAPRRPAQEARRPHPGREDR
ncbi:hypothetical protein [Geodermatophilus sp. SYSU D01105]